MKYKFSPKENLTIWMNNDTFDMAYFKADFDEKIIINDALEDIAGILAIFLGKYSLPEFSETECDEITIRQHNQHETDIVITLGDRDTTYRF